ncbi:MAG: hypothetical protein IJV38_04580 [Prevotella sp.]|nr:hypothetical protein [Prevotella sp.]
MLKQLSLPNILHYHYFFIPLPATKNNIDDMTIVSTTEFRANQTKYLGLVDRGERVILRTRKGSYHLTPATDEDVEEAKRDVTAEVCQALKDWKEYLDTGKSDKFRPANELIDELRNLQAQRL